MKRHMKKIALCLAMLIVVFAIIACSNSPTASSSASQAAASSSAPASASSAAPASSEAASAAASAVTTGLQIPANVKSSKTVNISQFPIYKKPADGKKLTFALLLFSRGFEWMIGLENQFKATAAELGVNAIVLDAQSSDQTQLNQIQDLITKQVDAIILTPNSNDGLIPGIEAANKAGIVLTTCEGLVTGGTVPLRVRYDNEKAGALGADFIANKLGGKGTVMETRGALASLSATGRHTGFSTEIAKYPDIKYFAKNAEWLSDNAQKFTSDMLTTNPELGAIFSNNDEMQTGIQAALKESGKLVTIDQPGHIVLVGLDGTPLALQRLKAGIQDATVVQDPFSQGKAITQNTFDFLMGKDVPEEEMVEPYLITKADADNPELWGNKSAQLK